MSCRKLIYLAHIHSHLNYCSNIFSLLSKKDLIRVETLPKKAVRLVCKKIYNSHTALLFIQTVIIPFQDLIQVNALCFMYEYRLNKLWNKFKPVFKNSIVNRSTFSSNLKSYFLHKLDVNYSIDCNCYFCTV